MTLIVEDGSIISGANSYVSETDLTAFASARNITLVGDEETLLTLAMDYIETLLYKGVKRTRTQGLQWPRTYVVVDGYYVDPNIIPQELKNGLMQCAISIDQGTGPQLNVPRRTIKEKVGDLEVEYAQDSVSSEMNTKVKAALWKILASGGSGANVITVNKG